MDVKLLRSAAEEIGLKVFEEFGINKDSWSWKKEVFVGLSAMNRKKIEKLRSVAEAHRSVRGMAVMIRDIDIWLKALDSGADAVHARTCRQFSDLLIRLIGKVPGHRVYERLAGAEDVYLAYYVNEIEYHPENITANYRHPAYVKMEIVCEMFGGRKGSKISFYIEDIRGRNTVESLAHKGFYVE